MINLKDKETLAYLLDAVRNQIERDQDGLHILNEEIPHDETASEYRRSVELGARILRELKKQ